MTKLTSFLHLEKTHHLARGEYRHIGLVRIITLLILGIFTFGGFQMMVFIYEHVYQSIMRTEAIVVLRSKIGIETIDFEQFRRVENAWQKKYATTTISVARDPFVVDSSITTTTAP